LYYVVCGATFLGVLVEAAGHQHLHHHVFQRRSHKLPLLSHHHQQWVLHSQGSQDCLVRWQAQQLVLELALLWSVILFFSLYTSITYGSL